MSAKNIFEEALHPRGFHGRFSGKLGPGRPSSAAAFMRGAGRAKLHLAAKKPMTAKVPEPHLPGRQHSMSHEERIHAAYKELSPPSGGEGAYVAMSRLREHPQLQGMSRKEQDAALVRMLGNRHVNLEPDPNQKTLRPEDRAAAVHTGGEARHLLAIERGYAPPKSSPPRSPEEERALARGHTPPPRAPRQYAETPETRNAAARKAAGAAKTVTAPAKTAQSLMSPKKPRTGLAHSPEEAAAHLKGARSAEEAKQYLAKATKAELMAVADKAGVSYRKSALKGEIHDTLVHHTVTRRLTPDVTPSHTAPKAGATPTLAPAGKATGTARSRMAGAVDPQRHVDHLHSLSQGVTAGNLGDRVRQAKAYVANVKGKELDALARRYHISGVPVARKRELIVHATVGGTAQTVHWRDRV